MRAQQAKKRDGLPCENGDVAFRFRAFMKKASHPQRKGLFFVEDDAHIVPQIGRRDRRLSFCFVGNGYIRSEKR